MYDIINNVFYAGIMKLLNLQLRTNRQFGWFKKAQAIVKRVVSMFSDLGFQLSTVAFRETESP